MVNTSVVRSKVDLRRAFYFDSRINWRYVNLKPIFKLRMLTGTLRYDTGEVENGL